MGDATIAISGDELVDRRNKQRMFEEPAVRNQNLGVIALPRLLRGEQFCGRRCSLTHSP